MKNYLFGFMVALAFAGVVSAHADEAVQWFDEPLAKYKNSSSGDRTWKTGAGRWTLKAGDRSACSNKVNTVYIDTCGNEISFKPYVPAADGYASTTQKPSPDNALTKLTVNAAVFTAFRGGEEWECVESAPLGGLSMRMHDAGDCTFIGWVSTRDSSCIKGRWLELSAAGLTAEENVPYKVTVESDYRCIPVRIRYSVNDVPLKDKNGTEWFSIRKASMDPSQDPKVRTTSFGFNGKGSIGAFSAETTSKPAERAAIAFEYTKLARPQPGETLTADMLEVTPKDGVTLGEQFTYRWYLTDAAGMSVVGSDRGTAAAYTLAEKDYCHWVTVDVSDENGYLGTGKYWFSNLPVMYIECKDAKGWVEATEETAVAGRIYYRADEDDRFFPLKIAEGADLAPYREQYGKLFLEDVKTAWPTSKKEDHKAKIFITGNKNWEVQYDSDGQQEDDEIIMSKIHVRGNSTASQDKKPYKIKLGKKADPFKLGGGTKNKHWTLLANCFDESLMRNKLCYDYSGELGLVSMHSEWVDVVMNGKFVGNYQLCQHIRVAEERINIYDWSSAYEKIAAAAQKANADLTDDDVGEIETLLEEKQQGWMTDGKFTYLGTNYTVVAKGTAGPDRKGGFTVVWKKFSTDVSGGYIFEFDWKKVGKDATAPAPSGFVMSKSGKGSMELDLAMNTPEYCFLNPEVSNTVWNCWNDITDAWLSGTGYNAKGEHYSELCDFDSMVAYWLSLEVPGNNDSAGLSRYAYKDRGGKVFFGPAWDFDYGLDSLQIRSRRATVTNEYGEATYSPIKADGWIPGAGSRFFVGGWANDPYFMFKLREKYAAHRPYLADMVKDGGLIDGYIEYLGPSARANDLRWNTRIGFFGNAEEQGDAYVVKEFLAKRFAWLDAQFGLTTGKNLGTALPEITMTADKSGRYARASDIGVTVTGATAVPGSPETSVKDVEKTVKTAPVEITLAVPTANAASLDVYLNGISNGTEAVESKAATVSVQAEAFLFRERNFLEFRVKDSSGKQLASNVALLTVNLPEKTEAGDGEDQTPVAVDISWLDESWAKLVAAEAVDPVDAPKTYAQYVAFANEASPLGKPTAIWQDFVAWTDPADADDVFKISSIEMADGVPKIIWTPDRKAGGFRKYTLFGANDLLQETWDSIVVDGEDSNTEDFRAKHNFFKVKVSLP